MKKTGNILQLLDSFLEIQRDKYMEVIAPGTCPYTLLLFKTRVLSLKIHKNESFLILSQLF